MEQFCVSNYREIRVFQAAPGHSNPICPAGRKEGSRGSLLCNGTDSLGKQNLSRACGILSLPELKEVGFFCLFVFIIIITVFLPVTTQINTHPSWTQKAEPVSALPEEYELYCSLPPVQATQSQENQSHQTRGAPTYIIWGGGNFAQSQILGFVQTRQTQSPPPCYCVAVPGFAGISYTGCASLVAHMEGQTLEDFQPGS